MWKVEIVSYDAGEVVKTLTAESERQAERAERGVNINLNHEKFYTRIVKAVMTTPTTAARAYDIAAKEYFGEHAKTNFD